MKTKKLSITKIVLVCILALAIGVTGVVTQSTSADAATSEKNVIVWSMKRNTLKYYKALWSDEAGLPYSTAIVGTGKRKTIKVAKNAKFYLLKIDYDDVQPKKVSKRKFMRYLNNEGKAAKDEEEGVSFVRGTACNITIKNGKVIKIEQMYQS